MMVCTLVEFPVPTVVALRNDNCSQQATSKRYSAPFAHFWYSTVGTPNDCGWSFGIIGATFPLTTDKFRHSALTSPHSRGVMQTPQRNFPVRRGLQGEHLAVDLVVARRRSRSGCG